MTDDVMKMFSLDGRTAVVTGASSGLGAALVKTFAGAGANVVAAARRMDRLQAVCAGLPACHPIECDVTSTKDLTRLVDAAHSKFGPIEILVNAAGGLASVTPAEDETLDGMNWTVKVNLIAPFQLSQLVFPDMKSLGRGAIVNISSISGVVGIDGIPQAAYAMTKRGLSGLAVDLGVEWGRHGIRVNALAAGFFQSEMTEALYADERMQRWLERSTPLPGYATPADICGAVLWLVSDAGRYVTGQTIMVDGGWTAR